MGDADLCGVSSFVCVGENRENGTDCEHSGVTRENEDGDGVLCPMLVSESPSSLLKPSCGTLVLLA